MSYIKQLEKGVKRDIVVRTHACAPGGKNNMWLIIRGEYVDSASLDSERNLIMVFLKEGHKDSTTCISLGIIDPATKVEHIVKEYPAIAQGGK